MFSYRIEEQLVAFGSFPLYGQVDISLTNSQFAFKISFVTTLPRNVKIAVGKVKSLQ